MTDNQSLIQLFKAIEEGNPIKLQEICIRFIDLPGFINCKTSIAPDHGLDCYYEDKHCLQILYATILRYNSSNLSLNPLIEIFNILHRHGLKWESICLFYDIKYTDLNFINALILKGNIDFVIRVLPLARGNMNLYCSSFVSSIMALSIIEFVDNIVTAEYLSEYISVLTPEIKARLICSYIEAVYLLKNVPLFPNTDFNNKIFMLLKCGEINWGNSGAYIRYVINNRIEIVVRPYGGFGEFWVFLGLVILYGLYKDKISAKISANIRRYMLDKKYRWMIQREISHICTLPIPLESRIQLWSVDGERMTIFNRQQSSILLRS